jgi:hypothetical protein
MIRVYETGKSEIALDNSILEVTISPNIGGRIVSVKECGKQFLYTIYPEDGSSEYEVGGIKEFIERPPGSLRRTPWQSKIEGNIVTLCIKAQNIFLEKRVSLDDTTPIVRIEYSLLNIGPNFVRHAFGVSSEICLDDDIVLNRYHIPTGKGILSGGCEQIKKRYVHPSQGWCAAVGERSLVAMLFPDDLLDGVEICYPKTNRCLSLSPLIYYAGISPGWEVQFACMIHFGEGDENTAVEFWEGHVSDLYKRYVKASGHRLEMAKVFEASKVASMSDEISKERQLLLSTFDSLERYKAERMNILSLVRDKQISTAEAIERFNLMKKG